MSRLVGLVLAAALAIAPLAGCKSGGIGSGTNYFPLTANSTWTYQIFSKSQGTQYQITDRVIGVKYVPALKLTGSVVDESYSLVRGGTRPLVYYAKDGYIARLSTTIRKRSRRRRGGARKRHSFCRCSWCQT
jgi:hypothetical protein